MISLVALKMLNCIGPEVEVNLRLVFYLTIDCVTFLPFLSLTIVPFF